MSHPAPVVARPDAPARRLRIGAGILFGFGLGGFFDGIVLHQVLQWHHMLSSWYPIDSLQNLERNTLWDGLFHSATYVFTVLGLFLLWRAGAAPDGAGSAARFLGAILAGWGVFNLVEGLIDHQILGIHHVNERVPENERPVWDIAFLAWGVAMLAAGLALTRRTTSR